MRRGFGRSHYREHGSHLCQVKRDNNTLIPISIGDAQSAPIDICIGEDHFTDQHIRKWATGNLEDIDFATGQEVIIIECLSLIIEQKILSALH